MFFLKVNKSKGEGIVSFFTDEDFEKTISDIKLIEELEANSTDTVPIMYGGLEKVEIINIPLHSPLKVGQEYTFEFKCSNWRHYAVINGDIWHESWDRTARKGGIYRMTVKITEPGSVMLAYSNGTSYNFFLEYTATY